jgi:hypothetical protein
MINLNIDIKLKNYWTVWYHKQDEANWDRDSYIKLIDIHTVSDFVRFKNSFIYLPQFLNGFYFFMKNGISPMWEDAQNCEGGCINIKVSKELVDKSVWDLFTSAIIDRMVLESESDSINGLSVVAKKYNAIIKIWNNDKSKTNVKIINNDLIFFKDDEIYYRSHLDNEHFGKTQK